MFSLAGIRKRGHHDIIATYPCEPCPAVFPMTELSDRLRFESFMAKQRAVLRSLVSPPRPAPVVVSVSIVSMQERHVIRSHVPNLIVAATLMLESLAYGQSSIPDISFSVTRDGESIQTDARVDLPVAREVAWTVLTDYERYPSFISSMDESKVVSRGPDGLVVEQKGRFSVLFFSQKVEARMLVSEHPPNVVESHSIGGDFRIMTGRYELLQVGNKVRLSYLGRLVPDFSLPPVLGMSIVRYVLQRNFREMIDEILRRDPTAHQALQTD